MQHYKMLQKVKTNKAALLQTIQESKRDVDKEGQGILKPTENARVDISHPHRLLQAVRSGYGYCYISKGWM